MPSPRLRSLGIALLIAAAFAQSPQTANAQTLYDWSGAAPGNWSETLRWIPFVPPGPPNTAGDQARFGVTADANVTVTVNGTFTVGQITFANLNGGNAYTLASGPGTLNLNNNAANPRINANIGSTGTQTINANLNIQGTGLLVADIPNGTVLVAGTVTGAGGLIKSGTE
jgi:hypothetical protein